MERHIIHTIGYQGMTPGAFISLLRNAHIDALLDIRAVPLSRKPGFSRNALALQLAENGITYTGLKGLGTPAAGRDAARKGQMTLFRAIFNTHLSTPAAQADMATACDIARDKRVCLLCFEHDPLCCHRLIVAEAMARKTHMAVEHLLSRPGLL